MLKQYDGRSFAEVLQTEVFANGSKLPDLMAAFGTVGVGTGGFGHLYDAAFLEVLRVLLWDISEEFMLPEEYTYPELFGPDEAEPRASPWALARAALEKAQECYPEQTFDEMFRVELAGDANLRDPNRFGSSSTQGEQHRGRLRHRRDDEQGHAADEARSPLRLQPAPDDPSWTRTSCARAARRPSSGSTWSRAIG